MPRLSIVIVTFNSAADVDACLRSISQGNQDIDHEIVVVDNDSRDGTPALVRTRWPGVHVIDAGANIGFAAANNVGIRQTAGELVLLLNPDTVVPPHTLRALASELDRRPDAAIVGPRVVDGEGRAEVSFGPMISPLGELRQKLLVRGQERRVWPVTALVERLTRRTRTVDWVTGACLMIRRLDLERVGLLDERYFMYTEDVDLCAAVRAAGRHVVFTAAVQIVHRRGRSVRSAASATERAYRRSQIAFYEKHHPRWAPLLRAYLQIRGRQATKPNGPSG